LQQFPAPDSSIICFDPVCSQFRWCISLTIAFRLLL
jgi:hypothetical protein